MDHDLDPNKIVTIALERVQLLLSESRRTELRDHAFGDRELNWYHPIYGPIASAYSGSSGNTISVRYEEAGKIHYFESLDYTETRTLFLLGTLARIERNDSTGPNKYKEGYTMPGLSSDDVLMELTRKN